MRIILIISLLFIMVGCYEPRQQEIKKPRVIDPNEELIYEGCEYIRYGHGIAHKGNCKNPIHKYN